MLVVLVLFSVSKMASPLPDECVWLRVRSWDLVTAWWSALGFTLAAGASLR